MISSRGILYGGFAGVCAAGTGWIVYDVVKKTNNASHDGSSSMALPVVGGVAAGVAGLTTIAATSRAIDEIKYSGKGRSVKSSSSTAPSTASSHRPAPEHGPG